MELKDVEDLKQEKREEYEGQMQRKRSNSWVNKRAAKAIRILGLDPSKEKIEYLLGLDSNQLDEVEQEQFEKEEEKIKKKRMSDLKINKKKQP